MYVKLVTARRLDRKVMNETSVTLTCTDHGQHALTSDVTLTVHVLDVNDNAPRFDVTSYSADVVENSDPGTFVVKVSAVDADEGDNGLVHYIIGNKRLSDLGRDYGQTREKTSRQKERRRNDDGEDRRLDRTQPYNTRAATSQFEHLQMYNYRTRKRRMSETELGRSGGDCVGRVNVDKHSGVVSVVGLIDFEYSPVINCQILAIDSGSPPKTGDDFHFIAIIFTRHSSTGRYWVLLRARTSYGNSVRPSVCLSVTNRYGFNAR